MRYKCADRRRIKGLQTKNTSLFRVLLLIQQIYTISDLYLVFSPLCQTAKISWNGLFYLLIFGNIWIKSGTVTHHILWSLWCMLWTSGRCWASVWGAFWSRTTAAEHIWRVASLVEEKENSSGNNNQTIQLKKSHILHLPLLECTEESVHIRNRERKWQPGPGVRLWYGHKVVAVFVFQPGIGRTVHQLGDQVFRTEQRQKCVFHNTVTSGLLSKAHSEKTTDIHSLSRKTEKPLGNLAVILWQLSIRFCMASLSYYKTVPACWWNH